MRPMILLGGLVAALVFCSGVALAQKSGGVLKMYHRDNPPSASIHEDGDQLDGHPVHVGVQQPGAVRPEQAAEQPADDRARPRQVVELERRRQGPHLQAAGGREVARRQALHRQGRRLHLRPADRQGREQAARAIRAQSWYSNVDSVDRQRRPRGHDPSQAAAAVAACRCSPRATRRSIPATCRRRRCAPSRSAPGRSSSSSSSRTRASSSPRTPTTGRRASPISTASSSPSCPTAATAMLSFMSGRFDITFPWEVTMPLLKDIKTQMPNAQCQVTSMNNTTNLIVNRDAPPFDNPDLRRALVLASTARPSSTSSTRATPQLGGTMQPLKDGIWGMPEEMLRSVPGYGTDVEKNREEARAHDEEGGLRTRQAPARSRSRPAASRSTRTRRSSWPASSRRSGSTPTSTSSRRRSGSPGWRARTTRSASTPPATASTIPTRTTSRTSPASRSATTPATAIPRSRSCSRCSRPRPTSTKRKKIVWEIDRKLLEDGARPIIMWNRAAICMQPYVKGYVASVNSVYNGFRFEDVWLDK